MRPASWDLILLDADFSGAGLEILGRLHEDGGMAPVVLLTARPTMDLAMEAIRQGAHDVLPKPLPRGRVREILLGVEEIKRLRPLPEAGGDEGAIVGASSEMMGVFKSIARAATSDATVLVLGESGTGKEMVARVLHTRSRRSRGPFVAINCAAIPENLLESELFGHEKGAFTGAIGRRIGRFERAHGGTLFLDEIGDMSMALQSKILRAIQEREVERVGGGSPVSIDVRIVAATNRDLQQAVREGRFREDLYYRLAVVTVMLPPLRERGSDLDLLSHALHRALRARARAARARGGGGGVQRAASPPLARQRAAAAQRRRARRGDGGRRDPASPAPPRRHPAPAGGALRRTATAAAVRAAAGDAGGDGEADDPPRPARDGEQRTVAAERLGIHRNTLRRKITDYGIERALTAGGITFALFMCTPHMSGAVRAGDRPEQSLSFPAQPVMLQVLAACRTPRGPRGTLRALGSGSSPPFSHPGGPE